jgi:hypothetical protein
MAACGSLEGYNARGGNRSDVWHSVDGVHWEEVPATPWKPRHAASVFVHAGHLWVVAGNKNGKRRLAARSGVREKVIFRRKHPRRREAAGPVAPSPFPTICFLVDDGDGACAFEHRRVLVVASPRNDRDGGREPPDLFDYGSGSRRVRDRHNHCAGPGDSRMFQDLELSGISYLDGER